MSKFERLLDLFHENSSSRAGLISQKNRKIKKLLDEIDVIQAEYKIRIKEREEMMSQIRNELYEIDPERYKKLWSKGK